MNPVVLKDLTATRRWAKGFAERLRAGDVVFLRGPLGAGKTALAQTIARHLGVEEPVTSPTYTLINEYQGALPVIHMDLYRLSGPEEFELVGGWDAMRGGGVTLIEWPERLDSTEDLATWTVDLELVGTVRHLRCHGPDGRSS